MSESEKKILPATLSPADAATVDAMLENGAGASVPQGVDPARQARVESWLKAAASGATPAAPADLLARTLVAVRNAPLPFPATASPSSRAAGFAPPPPPPSGLWRRRFAEFGAMAVAAALLVAVTLQGFGQVQRSKLRVACSANLKNVSVSFNDYANDWNGTLPSLALPDNGNWLHGNTPQAARNNSANLIPMVNHNYCPRTVFYCPGAAMTSPPPGQALVDELPPISYSYRINYGADEIFWNGRHDNIVMGDKNPLFMTEASTKRNPDQSNSPNHNGQGNYLLRADGSVTWETSPNVGPDHDNIWTIGSGTQKILTYTGVETPPSLADVILAP